MIRTTGKQALALFMGVALALGLAFGTSARATVAVAQDIGASEVAPAVDNSGLSGLELPSLDGAAPDQVLVTRSGKFVFDSRWTLECNIGALVDCDDNLLVKIGSDNPTWTGWAQNDGKWIRVFGDLTFLPAQCGMHILVTNPDENVRRLDDPCPGTGGGTGPSPSDPKATATPGGPGSGGGGTGGSVHVCTGSTVSAVFNVRSGSDDVVWSRQRGLEVTSSILSFGGSSVYDPIVGLRYRGVTVPRNAKIFSARVRVAPAANSSIAVDQDVYGANVGNAPVWGGSFTPGSAPRTASKVRWPIRDSWVGSQSCRYISTNDLGPPVQNVVDRFDWSSGNALALLFEWQGPFAEASQRPTWSLEGGCPPQLTITYCPAILSDGPTATPNSGGGSVDKTPTPGLSAPTNTPRTPPPGIVTPTDGPTPTEGPPGDPTETPQGGELPTRTPTPTAKIGTGSTATPTCSSSVPGTGCTGGPTSTPKMTGTITAITATATSSGPGTGATATPTPAKECNNQYDLNGDGVVDINDIDIVLAAFGSTPDSPNWDPRADVNGDGRVDLIDYLLVRENFGPACPEPGGGGGT